MRLAGMAASFGIDPRRLLAEQDPLALAVLQAALVYAAELRDVRDQNLAVRIANALGRVLR